MYADKVSLSGLLHGPKQFVIPPYQRAYVWSERQARQLWDDILTEAKRLANGERAGHFLGSLVLAPSPSLAPGGIQQWLVVDGQQRLGTLMIALSAIRDHVIHSNPQLAGSINDSFLISADHKGDKRPKLLATLDDRAAFASVLLNHDRSHIPNTNKIIRVYELFRSWIKEVDEQPEGQELVFETQAIQDHLHLVQIVAHSDDNAYRIFQTLNSTGLKLTETDLMRNHLFMRLPHRIDDIHRDVWTPMQQAIGDDGIETLLWLDLVLRGKDTAAQSDVFRLQVERFDDLLHEDQVAQEIVELARRSRYLRLILDPGLEPDANLRMRLARLKEWNAKTTYSTTMFVLELRDRGELSVDDAASALLLVESFCVRRAIAGVPTTNMGRILNAVPRELAGSKDLVGDLRDYLSASKRNWPDDARLVDAIQTQPFYLNVRSSQKAFVLRRLEEASRPKEVVDWNGPTRMTIEHVLPQSLTLDWRQSLAVESETFGIGVDELHGLVVHTLGNLTLSAYNPKLSNSAFPEKREILRVSALAMNLEIAASDTWDGWKISQRGQQLLAMAIAIWPGPTARPGQTADRDWSPLYQAVAAIPIGRWTTFGDLAKVIGSHPVSVKAHLASRLVENSWRVLLNDGIPSPDLANAVQGGQRHRLEHEGIRFGANGQASSDQRLNAAAIKDLLNQA
ncbi:alkylated DNA nucleotide flippase Atl1 [Allocatelliglobosispora scoriae]|uniref:Alkylated DNA nucleotide flippase Atl1 n=1 Tax=Allocatelliglobosispora scoriae TaxID=643052 RepID=A0A841BSF7_9ACTN|nr:DUF262 domain-containing protein [Allocatelliglobosispora scoriae]MBB5869662.1 alkylated DNA nucleotide flippase Atl1 [Allocatelliglobosispora scoriae]